MGVIVGLDVGTKTIGVACAYAKGRIARPKGVVSRRGVKKDVFRLQEILAKDVVEAFVVGLPFDQDGTERRGVHLARQIGAAVHESFGVPVYYQDEAYSTVEASQRLHDAGRPYSRQKNRIDAAAAAVILQDWLDGSGSL